MGLPQGQCTGKVDMMREPASTAELPVRERHEDRVIEAILQIVRLRTGGTIHGLQVEIGVDRVVLTGRTSSFHYKQLATHAALTALGDQTLNNLIEVN